MPRRKVEKQNLSFGETELKIISIEIVAALIVLLSVRN